MIALRNFVFELAQEEMEPKEADDKTIDRLKKKKIIIIGGNQNWISKLRNRFPDWTYVSPDASGAMDAKIVRSADKVYFFTEVLSHKIYFKFINRLRAEAIPFGYLRGTNINRIIERIDKDV